MTRARPATRCHVAAAEWLAATQTAQADDEAHREIRDEYELHDPTATPATSTSVTAAPSGPPDEWNRPCASLASQEPRGTQRSAAAGHGAVAGGNTVSPLGDAVLSARPVPSPTPAAANTQIGGLFGLAYRVCTS